MVRKQTMAVQCANICPIEYENNKRCHLRIFSRFLCVFMIWVLRLMFMLSTGRARFIFQFMVSKNVDTDDKFYRVLYELGRDVACDQIWVWHCITSRQVHTAIIQQCWRWTFVKFHSARRRLLLRPSPCWKFALALPLRMYYNTC